jgi:hypothetical protein
MLAELDWLMANAGQVEIATRLKGKSPERRAKIALARLRDAGVKPDRLAAIVFAIHALMADAPEKMDRTREFRIVTIAKLVHRLASGTHRRWEVPDDTGKIVSRTEMHAYPRSSGRVLRHLGAMLEKECEAALEHHLAGVVALKVAREAPS